MRFPQTVLPPAILPLLALAACTAGPDYQGPDAARPVTASAGDYVIELLERQADILQASHEKLIKIENILHETRVQNKETFIADMRARAEAAQEE